MKNMLTIIVFCSIAVICVIGKVGAGTFIVDHPCLFIGGFFCTYILYKVIFPHIKVSAVRKSIIGLFILPIFALIVGGNLTYWNIVDSGSVYFGLLPQWLVGPIDGNDFMWNGFGMNLIIGRVVPEALIPTYHYPGFTIFAIFTWIMQPITLLWGCLRGMTVALIEKPRPFRFAIEVIKVCGIGLFLGLVVIAITRVLVSLYL